MIVESVVPESELVAVPAPPVPTVGSVAPDFELPNQYGEPVRLSSLRGKNVVVVFYPWAFTSVCTGEMCSIRDALPRLQNDSAAVVAISCDARASLRAFAAAEGFDFPLLSDHWPHGAVAQQYGVFDARAGAALRGTFVIDAEGVIRWSVLNHIPNARDLEATISALDNLNPSGV